MPSLKPGILIQAVLGALLLLAWMLSGHWSLLFVMGACALAAALLRLTRLPENETAFTLALVIIAGAASYLVGRL